MPLFLAPLCLLSLAILVVATFRARRFGVNWKSRAIQAVSGIIALGSGTYFWLWYSAFTLVTVASHCPDYASIVSAGERHSPVTSIDGTDYFWIIDPQEGEIAVEGKNGVLKSYGYVTTIGMERVDFWFDKDCEGRADQRNIEIV